MYIVQFWDQPRIPIVIPIVTVSSLDKEGLWELENIINKEERQLENHRTKVYRMKAMDNFNTMMEVEMELHRALVRDGGLLEMERKVMFKEGVVGMSSPRLMVGEWMVEL